MTFQRNGLTLVVDKVPAEVCENWAEAYVAGGVTAELLRIDSEARQAQAIVLICDYASLAA